MQSRIRKSRSFKGHRSIGIQKITGIWTSIVLIVFFTSCSGLAEKKIKSDLETHLRKICLSSEGRGRAEIANGRHLFSLEMLHDVKKSLWSLGVQLPVGGDEVLHLDYTNALNGKVSGKGSFYNRILGSIKRRDDRKALRLFLLQLGKVLLVKDSKAQASSLLKGVKWKEESGHLYFDFPVLKNQQIRWEAFDLKNFYRRLRISLGPKEDSQKSQVKFDLFLSRCDS